MITLFSLYSSMLFGKEKNTNYTMIPKTNHISGQVLGTARTVSTAATMDNHMRRALRRSQRCSGCDTRFKAACNRGNQAQCLATLF